MRSSGEGEKNPIEQGVQREVDNLTWDFMKKAAEEGDLERIKKVRQLFVDVEKKL